MIREKQTPREIVIDLTGPQGNAFFLLGFASKNCNQLGLDADQVTEEMTEGDYKDLVEVFDRYFGNFVILER